jgi:hypothetical protein
MWLWLWLWTLKAHAGGKGPEVLGGEVFSVRRETVARHGKKLRRWLRIESDGRLSRRPCALKIERKYWRRIPNNWWIWIKHLITDVHPNDKARLQISITHCSMGKVTTQKKNSMIWVSERTIPTEPPLLVGEVIANFCGYKVPRGQRDGSLRPYSRFSRQEALLFYKVAPQLYSRGWVDTVPDPLLFFSGSAGNRTRASGSVAKNSDH